MKARAADFIVWVRPRRIVAATLVTGAVFSLGFVVAIFMGGANPASAYGVAAGIAATLSLVAVMLYSARRARVQVRSYGPARQYLELHLWGGALFALLVLLHTGFALPNSFIGWSLWLPSAWVVGTGAVGVLLQRLLPRFLAATETFEVNLSRAPELVAQLAARADNLTVSADPRLRAFYEQEVAPGLARPARGIVALLRNLRGGARVPGLSGAVDILRKTLTPEDIATLDALIGIQSTKHELDAHVAVQRVLRTWLQLHLPVAITLLFAVVLHILFIVYY